MPPGRKKGDGLGRFGGRAAGTPNKLTNSARTLLTSYVEKYFEEDGQFTKDFKRLKVSQKVDVMIDIAKHVIPKAKEQSEIEFETAAASALRKRLFGEE